jgi:phosphoglycerate kinase
MKIKNYLDTDLKNKTVIVRVDFNVPLKDGKVSDKTRLVESLPTIKHLLKQKCKVILISHLGRPDGRFSKEFSLAPVARALSRLLFKKVFFATDCIGPEAERICNKLKPGQIALLENLRFHAGEEENNSQFSKQLSNFGDIYINDAFGTAHRAHASTVGITGFLPSYAGHLLLKEVENLSKLFDNSQYPFTLIVGGAKIDTKIDIITSFAGKADFFLMGGGIANTFLASKGQKLGSSLVEKDKIATAKEITELLLRKHKNLILPTDYLLAKKIGDFVKTKNSEAKNLSANQKILDIGRQSTKQFASIIAKSKTIVWNGPMGVYEFRPFRRGTKIIAKAIAKATKKGAFSVLGGGDTIDALKILRISPKKFTHVSTGGGAMLEFIEKGTLPAIEALKV